MAGKPTPNKATDPAKQTAKEQILEVLSTKASTKQLVHRNVLASFARLKGLLAEVAAELNALVCDIDRHVVVEFIDRGEFESEIRFSGDALVFQVHTNAFALPSQHELRKSPWAKKDPLATYFGMIHVYNFLSDSFRFNRLNDGGYLMGRILINKHGHSFAEGPGKMALPFSEEAITQETLKCWIENAMLQAMAFDLTAAPMKGMQEVSVSEFLDMSGQLKQRTAKKLGFQANSEGSPIV